MTGGTSRVSVGCALGVGVRAGAGPCVRIRGIADGILPQGLIACRPFPSLLFPLDGEQEGPRGPLAKGPEAAPSAMGFENARVVWPSPD